MSESRHSVRFPGESESYRAARSELLEAEIQLRRNIEAVAAKRHDLPLGGMVPEDYVFDEAAFGSAERKVGLSELFADGKDTLIVYSFRLPPIRTGHSYSRARLRRKALLITETELKLIAAAAIIGLRRIPKNG